MSHEPSIDTEVEAEAQPKSVALKVHCRLCTQWSPRIDRPIPTEASRKAGFPSSSEVLKWDFGWTQDQSGWLCRACSRVQRVPRG